ncbi:Cyclin-D-binding Myb-like transcription factor 1-like 1 [Homarus americanus]|uniref:Cyclin-D-binding Myb-like transcription factor 1-like 1 n=1 Tax=Homarus americanus TaxID=6706 RepID=A0A8J5T1Q6_HOMAM|nr:Cyclin-D-binding Myb-like transcription factor 1-like 1 [Homarus americanus]
MEVIETVDSGEDGSTSTKRIRLLVTPDTEASNKVNKANIGGSSEQTTSVFLYSCEGHLVPAEIVMDSMNENIIAVPLDSGVVKSDKPVTPVNVATPLKVLETPGNSPKKQKSGPVITVRQVRTRPPHSDTNLSKLLPHIIQSKSKQVNSISGPKNMSSDALTKLQTKSGGVSTKILISTDIQTKSQSTFSSSQKTVLQTEMQVKSQVTNFQEERMPLLTDVTDKTAAQSGSSGHGSQTVMMRVNSLGELELDPLFLNTETLSESETEEVRLTASTDLTHDHLATSVLSGVNKTEGLNVEEVQVDLQTSSASQVETGNANVNQSWFTSREDKEMLRWRGHAWRQGMWSREETELLKHNIEQYCAQRGVSDPGSVIFKMSKEERSGFYRVVARGLNRPLFSVYRRIIRQV